LHTQAQDMLRNLLLGAVFLYWLMGLVSMAASLSPAATKTLWGSTSVAVLGVYYIAPLSSVAKVLAERDSSSLHWPLSTMNIINGMLWFAYGLALKDWFICLPVSPWTRRTHPPCNGAGRVSSRGWQVSTASSACAVEKNYTSQ
jgi:hypothetical protein